MKISFVKPKISIIFSYLLVGVPVGVLTVGVMIFVSENGTTNPWSFVQFLLTTGMLYGFVMALLPALLTGVVVAMLRTNFVNKLSCLLAGLIGLLITLIYLWTVFRLSSGNFFDSELVSMFLIPAFVASTVCCYLFVLEQSKKPN